MQPFAAWLVVHRKIWLGLAGFGEMRRHVIEFALCVMRHAHLCWIVHAGPRFGHDIGWMWIKKACPQKEGLILLYTALHIGNRPFAHPVRMMEFLGQIPGEAVAHVVGTGILIIGPVWILHKII